MKLMKWSLAAALVLPMLLVASPSGAAGDATQATVIKAVKKVEWQRARTNAWQKARVETLLMAGDTLRTGTDAKAELRYGDGSITRVGSLTTLTLVDEARREIRLNGGKVWLHIQKGGAGMRVITPGAVAAVTGTEFLVEFDPARKVTEVTVFEGSVNVSGDVGRLVRVLGGTSTMVPPRAPAAMPMPLDRSKLETRDNLFRPLSVESGTETPDQSEPKQPEQPEQTEPKQPEEPTSTEPQEPDAPIGAPASGVTPEAGAATPAPAAAPAPESAPAPGAGKPTGPDLKNQTDKLLDPRIINGSPTTGRVRVIIE